MDRKTAEELHAAWMQTAEGSLLSISGIRDMRVAMVKVGVPKALGMTRDEYLAQVPLIPLSADQRAQEAKRLTTSEEKGGEGLSQREAADVLGVSVGTVNNDLGTFSSEQPEPAAEHEAEPTAFSSEQPEPQPAEPVAADFLPLTVDPILEESSRVHKVLHGPVPKSWPNQFDPQLLNEKAVMTIQETVDSWQRWTQAWQDVLAGVQKVRRVK